MFNKTKSIVGVDIGNVITGDTDKSVLFSDKYLKVSQIAYAFEGIRELYRRFDGQVCLVSKCHGVVQAKTRHWLEHHQFFQVTGVNPNHVFFCEKREGKSPICQFLGVTHFIDDRLEVLGYLRSVQSKFLFNPKESEIQRHKQHLHDVKKVHTWQELLTKIV